MRKLITTDVFTALRIIKKADIKDQLEPYFQLAAKGELSIDDMGVKTVLGLMEILSENKAENAIYELLSGPFEMKASDIKVMDLDKMIEMLTKLGTENDLKVFTRAVSGLISTQR